MRAPNEKSPLLALDQIDPSLLADTRRIGRVYLRQRRLIVTVLDHLALKPGRYTRGVIYNRSRVS